MDELRRGIILLHCFRCDGTTKHQTLNKRTKRKLVSINNVAGSRSPRLVVQRLRKCLECGNLMEL